MQPSLPSTLECEVERGSSGASLSNKEPIRVQWIAGKAPTQRLDISLSFRFVSFSASALPCRHLVSLPTISFPRRSFLLTTRFRLATPSESISLRIFLFFALWTSTSDLCIKRTRTRPVTFFPSLPFPDLHADHKNSKHRASSNQHRGPLFVVFLPPPWKSI